MRPRLSRTSYHLGRAIVDEFLIARVLCVNPVFRVGGAIDGEIGFNFLIYLFCGSVGLRVEGG
jgi:hypothetical protein